VFYDLRHFYGSWHAARLGEPGALTLAELAESMGHASTKMTLDRYVHTEPDVDKRNAGAGMWTTGDANLLVLRRA
jgi:integrase